MTDDIITPLIGEEVNNIKPENTKDDKNELSNSNDIDDEYANLKVKDNNPIEIYKNKFIGKIYFIFFIQMSITFLFIYYAFNNPIFKNILQDNKKLFYLSIAIVGIIFCSSYQWKFIFKTTPFNFFFFFIFTLSISFIICKIVILFTFKTITILWILIIVMMLSLSFYSYNYKKTIQILPSLIFILSIEFTSAIFLKFFANVSIINIIFILLCLSALAIYLIYDIGNIIEEGKIGTDDYILLNILLYTDLFRLFMKLINIIAKNFESSDDKNEDSIFNHLKGFNEEIRQGIDDIKNLGKNDESDGSDESEEDKKKNKKEKNKKGKKDSKGKKNKKEDKKEDKKSGKDKKTKKTKNVKKSKNYKEEENSYKDDINSFSEKAGKFITDILGK